MKQLSPEVKIHMHRATLFLFGLCILPSVCVAAAQASAEAEPTSTVIAHQGPITLTLEDVDAYAEKIPSDERGAVFEDPQRIESILRNLLLAKQLAYETLSADGAGTASAATFSPDQYARLSEARIDELRDRFSSQVPDMSELARERYLAKPESFQVPRKVDVKHILISTKIRADANAKALAEKLCQELEKNPSQFQADVAKYSDDESKKENHGLIEFANSDRTIRQFSRAADGLESVGQITGPVKTIYGYHIIQAVKITPARQPTFAEVKNELVAQLRSNWIDNRVRHHVDELRSREIDANPDAIASLRTRYLDSNKTVDKQAKPATKAGSQAQSPN